MNCYIIYKGEESLKHIKVTLHFDDRSKECIVYLVTTNSTDECIERLKKKAEKYLVQNKVIETYSDNGLYKSIFNNISLPWIQFLLQNEPLILRLSQDLALISQQSHILPEPMSVFKIFSIIKPKQVKAILIGQDPYPQTGVADGIAFSTFQENSIPASLKNIFTELKDYENIKVDSKNPDLSRWVRNGCFLINASWTVTENKIGSHGNLWKQFVENLLRYILEVNSAQKIVVAFFGSDSKTKFKHVTRCYSNVCILEVAHPSPNSSERGFFNSKIFTRINENLEDKIDWR